MFLKITNNLTKKTHNLEVGEDKKTSKLFYVFDISIPDMDEGEYTYELYEEEKMVAQGLLQIGDYKRVEDINTEYKDNNNKTYIVYGE